MKTIINKIIHSYIWAFPFRGKFSVSKPLFLVGKKSCKSSFFQSLFFFVFYQPHKISGFSLQPLTQLLSVKRIIVLLLVTVHTLFFVACSNIATQPEQATAYTGSFDDGIIILDEGNFMTPNAKVNYLSKDLHTLITDIYSSQNNNNVLGDVLQHIGFYQNKAFLVVNNSNIIKVVNRFTFQEIATITENLQQPRYIAFSNNKIFVTNTISKNVTVYNATTLAYITSINLDNVTPEKILSVNNKIYVMKSYFGSGNQIAVINPVTHQVETNITLSIGLNSMVASADNSFLYALSTTNTATTLYRISTTTNQVNKTFQYPLVYNAQKLTLDNHQLYFVAQNSVFRLPENATTPILSPLFNVSNNGWSTFYGFNVIDNKIFASDVKGFTQNSEISVYNLQGELVKTFFTQIGANGFYINQ